MNSIEDKALSAQKEILAQLHEILEEKGIKEKVLADAQEMAKVAGKHILDENQPELTAFPEIPIEDGGDLEFFLIYDFLISSGFKFAGNVLKYESQHPDIDFDRKEFGKVLGLCTYDRTPYLVQLIEEMQKREN